MRTQGAYLDERQQQALLAWARQAIARAVHAGDGAAGGRCFAVVFRHNDQQQEKTRTSPAGQQTQRLPRISHDDQWQTGNIDFLHGVSVDDRRRSARCLNGNKKIMTIETAYI